VAGHPMPPRGARVGDRYPVSSTPMDQHAGLDGRESEAGQSRASSYFVANRRNREAQPALAPQSLLTNTRHPKQCPAVAAWLLLSARGDVERASWIRLPTWQPRHASSNRLNARCRRSAGHCRMTRTWRSTRTAGCISQIPRRMRSRRREPTPDVEDELFPRGSGWGSGRLLPPVPAADSARGGRRAWLERWL
jgi:hypothetical protein